jgi:enoyl-CoA hydratase/carnithine racemase
MSRTDTQGPVRVRAVTPGYWRATFANPPINLFDPDVFAGLRVLLERIAADDQVRVLVFDSADPDYFISHLDVDRFAEVPDVPGAASLSGEWHHFVTELAHSPVISIASIRGRARGIGLEFALACDMRFASREKAILAQPEVGFGVVPGGGGLDWLPRIAGRSRALEVITGAQDFDGATAERYGLVNRALPDAELDSFTDALATRIGGFSRRALATAKRLVNERSVIPGEGDLLQSFAAILAAITWPEAHARMAAMRARGWGTGGDGELNHPHLLGLLADELATSGHD